MTFTCPGIAMPQPSHAPFEGYVACARAGHTCTTAVIAKDDRYTEVRCVCCGEFYGSIHWAKEGT